LMKPGLVLATICECSPNDFPQTQQQQKNRKNKLTRRHQSCLSLFLFLFWLSVFFPCFFFSSVVTAPS
jgi:hypothetical protein